MAPAIVTQSSVTNLPKNNFNLTIMHAFGVATGGVQDLFGLDAAANIRFGLDFGISDRVSVGMGRSRFDKLFDVRLKAKLLRQTQNDSVPVEIAVKGDVGIMTEENGFEFADRLSYFSTVMIARKFSDRLSVQIAPMYAHFNTVYVDSDESGGIIEEENGHAALGLGVRVGLNPRVSLLFEFIPVLGSRSDGTRDEVALALNIETGGHVFQIFIKSSQWLTEQHVIARNTDQFLDGDFRFGF